VFTIKSDHGLSEANYDRALELFTSQFHYSCCTLHTGSSTVDVCRYFPDRHQLLREGSFTMRSIYLEVLGLMEDQPFNVSLFSFHNDMLIIFLKNIINECNFRFTNFEASRIIILAMKSLMEISLF
jgi:hypothetical protein